MKVGEEVGHEWLGISDLKFEIGYAESKRGGGEVAESGGEAGVVKVFEQKGAKMAKGEGLGWGVGISDM
jgi:hypothetical protein